MRQQHGFSLVEGLLILLVVAIVGFGGFYVWNQQRASQKNQETSISENQPFEDKCETTEAESPVSCYEPPAENTAVGYLAISEWGVKIPLDERTKDAYYLMENGYAYLQVAIDGDASGNCSNQAAVTKADEAWLASEENIHSVTAEDLEATGSKVNGVYYYITGSQSSCTEDTSLQDTASRIRKTWLDQNKHIVAAE